jgi:hypothetical protein
MRLPLGLGFGSPRGHAAGVTRLSSRALIGWSQTPFATGTPIARSIHARAAQRRQERSCVREYCRKGSLAVPPELLGTRVIVRWMIVTVTQLSRLQNKPLFRNLIFFRRPKLSRPLVRCLRGDNAISQEE